MTYKEMLIQEIKEAPEELLSEVLDFIRFLKQKENSDKIETLFASESSLKKDWLRPEEDEAWQGGERAWRRFETS